MRTPLKASAGSSRVVYLPFVSKTTRPGRPQRMRASKAVHFPWLAMNAHSVVKRPGRGAAICMASSRAEGPLQDFTRSAQRVGTIAWSKLSKAYVVVDDTVKRTAAQVDSKYDVSGKAQNAVSQVSEQAKLVDSRYGVKRRLRNLSDDIQRKWPIWQKQYADFSRTLPGQILFLSGIFFLFWSGIAWRLLNLVFIAWWLSPFLLLLYSRFNQKAAGDARRRQQEQSRRQQTNYFNAFFQNQQQKSQRQKPFGSARRKYDDPAEGPVIDVEYTTIDDQ